MRAVPKRSKTKDRCAPRRVSPGDRHHVEDLKMVSYTKPPKAKSRIGTRRTSGQRKAGSRKSKDEKKTNLLKVR